MTSCLEEEATPCPKCGWYDTKQYVAGVGRGNDGKVLVMAGWICPRCNAYIQSLVSHEDGSLRRRQLTMLRNVWLKRAPATKDMSAGMWFPVTVKEVRDFIADDDGNQVMTLAQATRKAYERRNNNVAVCMS